MKGSDSTTNTRPTPAEIKEWKSKYKKVHKIEVDTKEGRTLEAYVRQPVMKDIEHAMAISRKKGQDLAMSKTLYENCKLYADAEIEQNDEYLLSAVSQMGEVVTIAEGRIKEV